jgi:ADP-ribosylglycohydrolase
MARQCALLRLRGYFLPADLVIPNAIESSLATHGTPVAIAGACAVACAVSKAIAGADIEAVIRAGVHGAREVSADLASRIQGAVLLASGGSLEDAIDITGCGIETDEAVPAVFVIISKHHDFRSAVLAAVNLGGDADTIAGMVGAITGGMSPIPREWIDACSGTPEEMIMESWRCVSRFTDATGHRAGTFH